jgi:hypothetical protein
MEPRRLNVFQRIMRVWEEVHPYNAAQILRLEGSPDPERLASAWNAALATLGLGAVRVEGRRFSYEDPTASSAAQPMQVFDRTIGLEDVISQEMNRPFDASAPTYFPFRPFVLAGDGAYHAGIVYQHWVADSVAIRMLLHEWFLRMREPTRPPARPLLIPHGGFWHYFGPAVGCWNLSDGIFSTLRSITRLGNCRRIQSDSTDFHVRYSLHPLPDGLIDQLHARAHDDGVTLNDLFLAAMAHACDRHGPTPPANAGQELALGTIVDLRPNAREDMAGTFGLFLGFTTVVVRPAALGNRQALLRNIAAQNAWQKRSRVPQMSVVRMGIGLAQGLMLTPQQRIPFYRKYMPLAGGISNVNMNRSWAAQHHPSPLLDYIRVSPTGPMVPVVFTITTLGRKCHIALTRRSALVDDAQAARLVGAFIEGLG